MTHSSIRLLRSFAHLNKFNFICSQLSNHLTIIVSKMKNTVNDTRTRICHLRLPTWQCQHPTATQDYLHNFPFASISLEVATGYGALHTITHTCYLFLLSKYECGFSCFSTIATNLQACTQPFNFVQDRRLRVLAIFESKWTYRSLSNDRKKKAEFVLWKNFRIVL